YSVGSSLNPRFDRKADRNTYRQALITHEQTKRQLEDQIDQIKLEVRGAFRRLREAEQTHEIQRTSLELARRRVESAELMLQAGRATTRDLLEAREALVRAQNAVTAALISHRLERLNFERDIGRLRILEDGKWEGYEDQPGP
ncbi:MAG: TolC family protein, partial [Planctomycetes bacterium]|nr:TolC family protein [Planctomycetota bacterium]